MPVKALAYEELVPGYEFPPVSHELSPLFVSKYLKAVDTEGNGYVPPLAITALTLATVAESIRVPPGTVAIHASQEVEFFKLVPIGATIECQVRVAQKISRGRMRMLILDLEVLDKGKEKVQTGRTTIALPA